MAKFPGNLKKSPFKVPGPPMLGKKGKGGKKKPFKPTGFHKQVVDKMVGY